MLYFYEDKRSIKPFGKILDGVEKFFELCTPESRIPIELTIERLVPTTLHSDNGQYSRDELKPQHSEFLKHNGTEETLSQIRKKMKTVLEYSEHPAFQVGLRYAPIINWKGKSWVPIYPLTPYFSFQESTPKIVNFLSIGQAKHNPEPRTVWFIIYLATPFEEPDDEFFGFLQKANKALPVKLQPSRWRKIVKTKKGSYNLRKFKWPS